MEKFGIFNALEQFGSLFKSDNEKKSEQKDQNPIQNAKEKQKTDKSDYLAGATYINSPFNAESLEKFIKRHEQLSRKIDEQNK